MLESCEIFLPDISLSFATKMQIIQVALKIVHKSTTNNLLFTSEKFTQDFYKLLLQLDTADLIKLKSNTNMESVDVAMISMNLNGITLGATLPEKKKTRFTKESTPDDTPLQAATDAPNTAKEAWKKWNESRAQVHKDPPHKSSFLNTEKMSVPTTKSKLSTLQACSSTRFQLKLKIHPSN